MDTFTPDFVDYVALDRLGDEIAELSAHLEAATARLLHLIREFDARGGWDNGFTSCAAWLSWRAGLDLGAARERVRVARALERLPRLAHALACGELSYAKVRALTASLRRRPRSVCSLSVARALRATSSASSAAGVESTGSRRRVRPLAATRAGRCACIRMKTAWWSSRGA